MEPSTLNRTRGRTHGSEWWMTLSSIHWLKHHWMKLLGLLKQWQQKLAIDSKVGSHPNPLVLFLDFILLGDTMLDVCLIMVNNTLHALIIMQWLFWTLKVLYHRTWFYGPINSSRSFLCQKMQCAAQNFLSIFAFSIAHFSIFGPFRPRETEKFLKFSPRCCTYSTFGSSSVALLLF